MALTIREFFKRFSDDDACLTHLFEVRFGQGHVCPKCGTEAKWYKLTNVRAYSCQWCGHHLHPTAGTLFEDSRTALQLWFYAIYLFTTSRHGVPAKELQRQLGVTYKTAWRMGHEIRKHMAAVDGDPQLRGQVEVDETYIGGVVSGKGRGLKMENKTVVVAMVQRGGDVKTKVMSRANHPVILKEIHRNVRQGSTIHTDESKIYERLATRGFKHKTVDHGAEEYATKDGRGTNTVEGFFGHLKNSLSGTHVSVSGKHLASYVGEFEYRYNSRQKPEQMIDELLTTFPKLNEE
ncbi:MAG TPA: IS1595 family transposase [Geminicoccus sp.]|jgi:transposase-like protein/Zn ribbon nucleic-acid-binding protein|nr:IS1595 family transposase [Geminicoccus sp.]HEX2528697.1 IS1595 family transposase [Geminicoccus sp.]